MNARGRGRLRVVPERLSSIEQLNRDLMGIATMFEAFARNAIPLQGAIIPPAPGERPWQAPQPTRQEVARLALSIGILRIGLEEFEQALGAYGRTMKR